MRKINFTDKNGIQKDDEETSWNDGWQRWKKGQIQASLLTYK